MYYIGVDLGGTKIAVGIVNVYGRLLYKHTVRTEAHRGVSAVLENLVSTIERTVRDYGISLNNVAGIGVGCPGVIDSETGTVISAFNIKDMKNVCLAEEIEKKLFKKVVVSNDANCAVLGERAVGAARGYNNVIMITLGTGIGGGIIIDGNLYEGGGSRGAELGHIVIHKDGRPCTCGRKGCWEAYASATALIRETKEAAEKNPHSILAKKVRESERVNGRTIFAALNEGCELSQKVLADYLSYVSEGIVDFVNVFRPEIVLIGGGISNEGETLLKPIRKHVKENAYGGSLIEVPKIEKAMLGNEAGIIGAAIFAKNTIGKN